MAINYPDWGEMGRRYRQRYPSTGGMGGLGGMGMGGGVGQDALSQALMRNLGFGAGSRQISAGQMGSAQPVRGAGGGGLAQPNYNAFQATPIDQQFRGAGGGGLAPANYNAFQATPIGQQYRQPEDWGSLGARFSQAYPTPGGMGGLGRGGMSLDDLYRRMLMLGYGG